MVIGFAGQMRVGKDTAGKYLVEQHGYRRIALADNVKRCCAVLLNVPVDSLERRKNEPAVLVGMFRHSGFNMGGYITELSGCPPISVRHFMQRMGTEVGRDILGQDTWIRLALNNVTATDNVVITDVRFQNEVDYIEHNLRGIVIKIFREQMYASSDHQSELGNSLITAGNVGLYNNGTIPEFHKALDEIMERINNATE